MGSTFGIGHSSFGFIASLSASPVQEPRRPFVRSVLHTVQVNNSPTTTDACPNNRGGTPRLTPSSLCSESSSESKSACDSAERDASFGAFWSMLTSMAGSGPRLPMFTMHRVRHDPSTNACCGRVARSRREEGDWGERRQQTDAKSGRARNLLLVVIALTFLSMALLAASTNCYDRLCTPLLSYLRVLSACQRRIGKKIRLSLGFSTVERSPRAAPAWRAPRAVSCTRCGRRAPAQGRWRAALGGQRVQG